MPVEALRGVPWTLLTYAATRVVTLATTLVLARLLAPEDFGLFAMALLGMELLSVFSGLWLGAALIVRPDLGRRGQGTVLTLLMAAGAVFALGLLAATPFVAAFFGEPRLNRLVTVLAAVLVVSGVNWFYETLLQRELAFRRRFVAQMVRTVAFSVVALELALLGAEAWSLPVAYLCGHLAHAIALLHLAPYRVRPAFDYEEARRIVRGGRGFLGQDLATFMSQNADYLAVGRILGPAQLGFYAMAYRQAELPHYAIAEPVGKVTFPAFAQMRHRGEDVRSAFLDVLRMIALVTCPAGVVLSAAAVPFTLALLGEEWLPMAAPLAVLGIWALMRPLQVTVGNLLNSLGRAHVYGRVSLVALLPLVAATFAAAPLGTTAVAWVLVAHMAATLAVLIAAAARHAGVRAGVLARALWPFVVATAVAWVLTRATATATAHAPAAAGLVACVAVCLTAYLAVLAVAAPDLPDAVRRALGRRARGRVRRRVSPVPALAVTGAALIGALAAVEPKLAVGLVAGGLLLALAFVAPVAHLVLLVLVTAIVPYDVQNAVAFGRGAGSPGLLPSDVLLIGGLVRAGLVLLDTPLTHRARWLLAGLVAFLGLALLQAVHGVRAGYDAGTAGAELRVLAGFGTAIVALPILADPGSRERLFKGLLFAGVAIGLWGIVQWTVDIPFTAAGDAGVRAGVRFTEGGRGQIQGGLFAFPVVVVMGAAALLSDELHSARARVLVGAVVALNAIDLLLTYERTFWVATVLALVVLVLRSAPRQRVRALVAGPALVAVAIAGLATVAPRDVAAAHERLVSLGEYGSDLSVRYRLTESRSVMSAIEGRRLTGSGLGATIVWGRAYEGVRPTVESFAHNGYLWLVWKLGLPVAALLVILIGAAVLLRGPPVPMRTGAQAALLLLLVASVTFPAFNALGITAAMGVLVALGVEAVA
jgi:O-antigen/teichoic acid export membrane protein